MKLGVIGCGKMGTALVEGAIRSGAVAAADVTGVDPVQGARDHFAKSTGAAIATEISAIAGVDVILLCTKPHDVATALRGASIASHGKPLLIISIAAGITLDSLETTAAANLRVIRAMPNTPALVGKGAAGYCLGSRATREDADLARQREHGENRKCCNGSGRALRHLAGDQVTDCGGDGDDEAEQRIG